MRTDLDYGVTRLELDADQLASARTYSLLNSVVVPRPIAWVSTVSADGVDNLAPHSFFTIASAQPPIVQFTSIGTKDSLRNVLATREFVVAVCTEELLPKVNATGTDYPPDVSEFDAVGLTREASRTVSAARVAESPVNLECVYAGSRSFGDGAPGDATVVFGRVTWFAFDEAVLIDGRPAVQKLKPVARLGANEWSTLGTVTSHRRIPFSET